MLGRNQKTEVLTYREQGHSLRPPCCSWVNNEVYLLVLTIKYTGGCTTHYISLLQDAYSSLEHGEWSTNSVWQATTEFISRLISEFLELL